MIYRAYLKKFGIYKVCLASHCFAYKFPGDGRQLWPMKHYGRSSRRGSDRRSGQEKIVQLKA
jgi:hypothetical protein